MGIFSQLRPQDVINTPGLSEHASVGVKYSTPLCKN